MSEEQYVKILFRFYSNLLERWTVETLWAFIVDADKGLYKIDNIPFYVPLVASDDIVFAEYDEDEERLIYRKTIEYSGNSTIHVVIMDEKTDINSVRDVFKTLGCVSERVDDNYFAMEVPASISYDSIKYRLEELEKNGIIGYAESCLSNLHRYV